MANGGYQGNPGVIMPYRKRTKGTALPDWQEDLNKIHRKVRARIEHALARMKTYKILRDYRRAGHTLAPQPPVSPSCTTSPSPADDTTPQALNHKTSYETALSLSFNC
jgi:hypothetical protein